MGPIDNRGICETCNILYNHCPGHCGHIELDVPVYYPMYFTELIRLLKLKCIVCHKFRLSMNKVRYYLIRLKLLEMENINEANSLMEFVNPTEQLLELDKDEYEMKEQKADITMDIEKKLQFYEKRYEAFIRMKQTRQQPSSSSSGKKLQTTNTYIKSLQRELIDSFYKMVQAIKRCENCGSFSPGFRKDGANKIFQKPLSKKNRMSMSAMKKSYKVKENIFTFFLSSFR